MLNGFTFVVIYGVQAIYEKKSEKKIKLLLDMGFLCVYIVLRSNQATLNQKTGVIVMATAKAKISDRDYPTFEVTFSSLEDDVFEASESYSGSHVYVVMRTANSKVYSGAMLSVEDAKSLVDQINEALTSMEASKDGTN